MIAKTAGWWLAGGGVFAVLVVVGIVLLVWPVLDGLLEQFTGGRRLRKWRPDQSTHKAGGAGL